jgi:hypothetical protein
MRLGILALGLLLVLIALSGCLESNSDNAQKACIDSGGEVKTAFCCKSAGDFPNNCLIGACGCSPENSHEVKICDCGEGKCFDGKTCVPAIETEISSFEECVAAGYAIMESYPRQCLTPQGNTFVEDIGSIDYMHRGFCEESRGHWNECSNRCQIDNQGKTDVACDMMCEALCECGGIAGHRCPDGYYCKMPEGIADALGYCVMGSRERPPEEPTNFCSAPTGEVMRIDEAKSIAAQSSCANHGLIGSEYFCNSHTGTWWIDLEPFEANPICNPACVVDISTGEAEVNWRCTGALPE